MSDLPEDQLPSKRPNDSKDEPACSKPKKCRRGKKKKFRNRTSDQQTPDGVDSDGFRVPLPPTNAEKKPCSNHSNRRRNRKVLIRPVDVPKAPENSTQFIIDDHDECHLYFNFEKPNPFNSSAESKSDSYEDDAAFQDIDYQYESLQDLDNSAYYIQDFETNYFNMRYEEMLGLPRQEIMDTIENMETRVLELEDKLYEQDPRLALEKLQQKLLQLQEEHSLLSEHNSVLRKALENKESCLETNTSLLESSQFDDDMGSHSCEECDSSPDSSQHSENDEEYIEEEMYSQEDNNYLPEYNAHLHITHEHLSDASDGDDEDYTADDAVEFVDDIRMLQNNYRAHHISEVLDSYSSDGGVEHNGDASGEDHYSSEQDMHDSFTPENYSYATADIDEDSNGRVETIGHSHEDESEMIPTYDVDSNSCDVGDNERQQNVDGSPENILVHLPVQDENLDDAPKDNDESVAIVSSSAVVLEELSNGSVNSIGENCDIKTNKSENEASKKADGSSISNRQNVCNDTQVLL